MQNIDDEIRSHIDAFASTLTALVRQAALESVSAALGGATLATATAVAAPTQAAAKRGRGRPRKPAPAAPLAKAAPAGVKAAPAAKAAPATRALTSRKAAAPKRASGEKRPPAELARLTEKLGEYIKAHPGLRIEPIGKALGAPTKDLTLPVKKLLAAKKIRSEGQKRATEYFAA